MIPPDEVRHLVDGPRSGERPGGVGTVRVTSDCDGEATFVLHRLREVMTAVLAEHSDNWPSIDVWKSRLPSWFVDACAEELTQREALDSLEWWRTLSPSEQQTAEQERRWALADWLHWLQPDERQWFWWDASTEHQHRLDIDVQVNGWPAAVGALGWLLRAAGAGSVSVEEGSVAE